MEPPVPRAGEGEAWKPTSPPVPLAGEPGNHLPRTPSWGGGGLETSPCAPGWRSRWRPLQAREAPPRQASKGRAGPNWGIHLPPAPVQLPGPRGLSPLRARLRAELIREIPDRVPGEEPHRPAGPLRDRDPAPPGCAERTGRQRAAESTALGAGEEAGRGWGQSRGAMMRGGEAWRTANPGGCPGRPPAAADSGRVQKGLLGRWRTPPLLPAAALALPVELSRHKEVT